MGWLVRVGSLVGGSSTSTALRAEYEYEYECGPDEEFPVARCQIPA